MWVEPRSSPGNVAQLQKSICSPDLHVHLIESHLLLRELDGHRVVQLKGLAGLPDTKQNGCSKHTLRQVSILLGMKRSLPVFRTEASALMSFAGRTLPEGFRRPAKPHNCLRKSGRRPEAVS